MRSLGWFVAGGAVALIVLGVAIRAFISGSALQSPGGFEESLARSVRGASVPGEAKARTNPVPVSDQVLAESRAHWADHCAGCHANNGSGDADMGKRMYPPAPDMRAGATQEMTDGELFYVIENGIRLTGMPGWGGKDHDENDSWKLVHFIRHLPKLTAEEEIGMRKLNPKTAEEWQEEQEEREFLEGGTPSETQHHGHH